MDPASADRRLSLLQLQARYGDLVTRRDWDAVHALFLPDCTLRLDLRDRVIEHAGADAIVEFVSAGVGQFDFFLFSVENAVIDVSAGGDDANGRLYIRETRVEAAGRKSTAFGLYRDRYRRTSGGWRFAHRDYATLARTNPAGDGLEVYDVPE